MTYYRKLEDLKLKLELKGGLGVEHLRLITTFKSEKENKNKEGPTHDRRSSNSESIVDSETFSLSKLSSLRKTAGLNVPWNDRCYI